MFTEIAIRSESEADFLRTWEARFRDPHKALYTRNIGRPLSKQSLLQLFTWKNGGPIAEDKQVKILRDYPTRPAEDLADHYLNGHHPGSPIWNIFYLHCLKPQCWPIYDQHTHRAMIWIQSQRLENLPPNRSIVSRNRIYTSYRGHFIPFMNTFRERDWQRVDHALFAFGKFLKKVGPQL